jgi:hypothetical protein
MGLLANIGHPDSGTCKNLNPKRDSCRVRDPMDCSTKKKCQFGHAITNSSRYQKSVGCKNARCEFDRTAKILKECYDVKVKTPFKCRV